MSIKADALSDEIAKLLSEYEAEIVKNTDACGKLGRDKRERRVW